MHLRWTSHIFSLNRKLRLNSREKFGVCCCMRINLTHTHTVRDEVVRRLEATTKPFPFHKLHTVQLGAVRPRCSQRLKAKEEEEVFGRNDGRSTVSCQRVQRLWTVRGSTLEEKIPLCREVSKLCGLWDICVWDHYWKLISGYQSLSYHLKHHYVTSILLRQLHVRNQHRWTQRLQRIICSIS